MEVEIVTFVVKGSECYFKQSDLHRETKYVILCLKLPVLKTNAVNFHIYKYSNVLQFCEITPSKLHGNYLQKISEYKKYTFVIHTKVAASNTRRDIHDVH